MYGQDPCNDGLTLCFGVLADAELPTVPANPANPANPESNGELQVDPVRACL